MITAESQHLTRTYGIQRRQVLPLYAILSLAALFLCWGVPLTSPWDSTWYYQNAHFMRTGEYVWQLWYSNFKGASQMFYPAFGYSLWIYLSQQLQDISGVGWFFWLKALQFGWYLHSAWLVYAIGERLKRPAAGVVSMILFFLYFPFLHNATFTMSDLCGLWLLLVIVWSALKGIQDGSVPVLGLCFLLAGYAYLVRTVLLAMLPIIAVAALLRCRLRPRTWVVLIALALAPSAAQSLWSKRAYGNYMIRTGTGCNFYERVITQDESVPANLGEFEANALRNCTHREGDRTWYGGWCDLGAYLNDKGYSQYEIEAVAGRLAWAGFKENKLKYLWRTVTTSSTLAVMHEAAQEKLFRDPVRTFADLRLFGKDDPQQAMLVNDLIREEPYYNNELARASLAAHYAFGDAYDTLVGVLHLQYVIVAGYLLWVAILAWRSFRGTGSILHGCISVSGKRASWYDRRLACRANVRPPATGGTPVVPGSPRNRDALILHWIVAAAPAIVIVVACMFGSVQVRYRLPAEPFLILGSVLGIAELTGLFRPANAEAAARPPGAKGEASPADSAEARE